MSATHRYRNWLSTSYASTAIDGVNNVSFNRGIQKISESADADLYPTVAGPIYYDPSFSVTTINAGIFLATSPATYGIFTTTLCDHKNFATTGGGALSFTTNANSYISDQSVSGAYNKVAEQQLTFSTQAVDGVTNPVVIAAV